MIDPMAALLAEQALDRAIELVPHADLPAWPDNVTDQSSEEPSGCLDSSGSAPRELTEEER